MRRGAGLLLCGWVVLTACEDTASPDPAPAPVSTGADEALAPPSAEDRARVEARLVADDAYCAQIKSVDDQAEAERLKADIERALGLPVDIKQSVIKRRGTWYRICVGAFVDRAAAAAQATAWTAPGGALAAYVDEVKKGQAAFLVKPTRGAQRVPTDPQIARLAQLAATGPVYVERGAAAAYALTATDDDVVLIGGAGGVVDLGGLVDDRADPCLSCARALRGDVTRGDLRLRDVINTRPGREALFTETAGRDRFLTALSLSEARPVIVLRLPLRVTREGRQTETEAAPLDHARWGLLLRTTERISSGASCRIERRAAVVDRSGQRVAADALPLDEALVDELVDQGAGALLAARANDPVFAEARVRRTTATSLGLSDRLNLLAAAPETAPLAAQTAAQGPAAVVHRPCGDFDDEAPVLTELSDAVFEAAPAAVRTTWLAALKAQAPARHAALVGGGP